ncbi:hypothetical protein ACROYT_G027869 [Oculina patagonica]
MVDLYEFNGDGVGGSGGVDGGAVSCRWPLRYGIVVVLVQVAVKLVVLVLLAVDCGDGTVVRKLVVFIVLLVAVKAEAGGVGATPGRLALRPVVLVLPVFDCGGCDIVSVVLIVLLVLVQSVMVQVAVKLVVLVLILVNCGGGDTCVKEAVGICAASG